MEDPKERNERARDDGDEGDVGDEAVEERHGEEDDPDRETDRAGEESFPASDPPAW